MKDILTEMKNNYRESTTEKKKLRIKSAICTIRKQKTSDQNSKIIIQKNENSVRSSGTTSSIPTVASWGGQRRRESKNLKICLKKMTENP